MEAKQAKREALLLQRQQEAKETADFKLKLEKKYGTSDNPKRFILWDKAWDHGHSSGLGEVELYYSDFLELVMD